MPSRQFLKGSPRVATQSVSDPDIETGTAGEIAVSIADLVVVEDLVAVQGDMASGVASLSFDSYSIDGNTVTLDLETDDGTIGDAVDADIDELIITARGY